MAHPAPKETVGHTLEYSPGNSVEGTPMAPEREQCDSEKEKKSPGVLRMEAIVSMFTRWDFFLIWLAMFMAAYARNLGATVIGTYVQIILSLSSAAGKAATVGIARQVITVGSMAFFAKLGDYLGRTFLLVLGTILFAVGGAILATSNSLGQYFPGLVFYQLAFTSQAMLFYVLSVDTTTLRNRLFINLMTSFPLIPNIWAAGVVAQKTITTIGWRWGIGMWAIIYPAFALFLLYILGFAVLRARRAGKLEGIPSTIHQLTNARRWGEMFWAMDFIGLGLLCAALALFLLPISPGGGVTNRWKTASVLAPLCVGFCLFPVFVIWELRAPHPLIPFRLLRDRHVLALLLMSVLGSIATNVRGVYLFYTLVVSFNQSIEGATRLTQLSEFVMALTAIAVSFILRYFRRVKPVIVPGTCITVLGMGLLIRYRGGYSKTELAGLIAGEVITGLGRGMVFHPGLVALQSVVSHEHVAAITACYIIGNQGGAAISAAIAGGVWTNMAPTRLRQLLQDAGVPDAPKQAEMVYGNPMAWILRNPPGSAARMAVLYAYRDLQRTMCIVSICLLALLVPLAIFALQNVELVDARSLEDVRTGSDAPVGVKQGGAPVDSKGIEVGDRKGPV